MAKPTGINPKLTIPYKTAKKRGLLININLVTIICLVLVASLTGCVPKAPHEQMIAALKKVNDLEYQELATKVSMGLQSDNAENQRIYQVISQISYELTTKFDKKDRRFLFDCNLLYKGENCGNLALYCDMEKITVQSVFLGPKSFYFEWKDLQKLAQDYFDLQIQITDYLPLLFETDEKTREQVEMAIFDFYTDYFRDKITVSKERVKLSVIENNQEKNITCKELVHHMDNDDFSPEEVSRLLQGIFGNPAIRTLIKDKITQFITIAKNNGDLATWPVSEEQLIAFRDNIDAQIDHFLTLMVTGMVQTGTKIPPTSFGEIKIRIDQKGLWRNMITNQTMEITDPNTGELIQYKMMIEQNLINPGQVPTFPDFLPTEAINVGQISAAEWEVLVEEISVNLSTQVMLNPLFQDIIQLSTEQIPEISY